MLALVTVTGCESGQDAKYREDMRNLAAVAKAQQDELQRRLDDATAVGIFGVSQYLERLCPGSLLLTFLPPHPNCPICQVCQNSLYRNWTIGGGHF
jgi:hypothetical protein